MKKNTKIQYASRYSGNHYSYVPKIQLQGKWIEKIGFSIGDTVAVEYHDNAITIRPLTADEKHELTYAQLEKNIKKQTAILEALKVAENSDCYNQ